MTEEDLIEVRSPMPAMILTILVKAGDQVSENADLLILDSMKVETEVKSPCAAVVEQVLVEEEDSVEEDALLVTLRPN